MVPSGGSDSLFIALIVGICWCDSGSNSLDIRTLHDFQVYGAGRFACEVPCPQWKGLCPALGETNADACSRVTKQLGLHQHGKLLQLISLPGGELALHGASTTVPSRTSHHTRPGPGEGASPVKAARRSA